jgi:hypothetical protein
MASRAAIRTPLPPNPRSAPLKAIDAEPSQAEITPVTVKGRKGETVVERDETPFTVDLSKIPR